MFSYHESVTSMLKELEWPSLQQRRAEKIMALFHCVANETVDVEASALMTRTKRSSRNLNRVLVQNALQQEGLLQILLCVEVHHTVEQH